MKAHFKQRWPGIVGMGLMTLITTLWMFWSMEEMYYEGWWGGWKVRLAYLIPGMVCWLLLVLAVWQPRIGGWALVLVGTGFTIWWWGPEALRGTLTLERVLSQAPMCAAIAGVGVLFLLEGRWRRQREALGWQPAGRWVLRNLHWAAAVGAPLVVILGSSAANLPGILARVDDGDRGARRITGDGVDLVWAPRGPGWNWLQDFGGYPSWNKLAWYGVEPVGMETKYESGVFAGQADMDATGLCRYLSADGLTLMEEPQNIWRMPTVEEMVASFSLHGENCGCEWLGGGINEQVVCSICQPDLETPLWAPDESPIYYWVGEEYDEENAYYVSYNGWVKRQPKSWGNPRHGYRCVREPEEK